MDDAELDALARQDSSVIASDPSRLVIRTSIFMKASRRVRLAIGVAALLVPALASAVIWHLALPGVPLLPAAGMGLCVGVLAASAFLIDTRLVATASGQGLSVERRFPFRHSKSRRLLIDIRELTGFDVRPVYDEDSSPGGQVAYVLRLHAGTRRVDAWSTFAPDIAGAVGQRIMRLASAAPPGTPPSERDDGIPQSWSRSSR